MRFVILHHFGWSGRGDHFDLMIEFAQSQDENATTLKTFSTVGNCFPSDGTQLTQMANHRRAYLHFEGELSGQRGRVERTDEGEASIVRDDAAGLEVRFSGTRLKGRYLLDGKSGGPYTFKEIRV